MKSTTPLLILTLTALGYSGLAAAPDLSKLPAPAKQKGVTYAKDIRPLLEASCLRCHGEERPKADLHLGSLEGVLKGSKEGKVIVPGKSDKSPLVIAISQLDEEKAMPPKPKPGQFGRGPGGGPGGPPPAGERPAGAPAGGPPPGGAGRGGFGPPPKPLTADQVALVRAWIDQGAK
jgi:hypothetical protein